ncbi:MAG: ABC transporter permease, partial [Anaerolineae bacterium]|nr:ABC transporter permease [Anaerolineae bacterium]
MALSIHRLLAIARKELRHITRDVRIFFLVTLSPAFLLLVLANIFALDANNATVAWLDYDRTPTSRAYQATITADGTFRIVEIAEDYAGVEAALRRGGADLALVIPAGFEASLLRGIRPAVVLAVADGV